jgi:hypothetical protein
MAPNAETLKNGSNPMKKWRKLISLTALISFIFMMVSSTILYIVPEGRVAYWADWHLWGMTKTDWGHIHINLGVLFLIAMALHVYLNWAPIVSYLKSKAKELRVFTKDFNLALIITAVVIVGTYLMIPPFSTIIQIGEGFKKAGSEKYGEPPYGHAELSSVQLLAKRLGWNPAEAHAKLAEANIQMPDPKASIKEIADANKMTPQQVYLIMKPEERHGDAKTMPAEPQAGLGKLLLSELCKKYDLQTNDVIGALNAKQIEANGDMTIKDIAQNHQMAPIDVYYAIKEIADSLLE